MLKNYASFHKKKEVIKDLIRVFLTLIRDHCIVAYVILVLDNSVLVTSKRSFKMRKVSLLQVYMKFTLAM